MNFSDLQDIRNKLKTLPRLNTNSFKHIMIEHFHINIYAGDWSNCFPKKILSNLIDYDEIEIDVFERINNDYVTFHPTQDIRFKCFEWATYFTFLEMAPKHTAGNLPINTFIIMIRDIYRVSQLKSFY